MEFFLTENMFDLTHTMAAPLLSSYDYPWEALPHLSDFILALGETLPEEEYEELQTGIWVARDASIAPTASLHAPCIIGHRTEVRHCAYVRGSALVGCDCVVGNSCELKNCILFDGAQVPHFNYVGDSVLGYRSHMGAGAITSNIKSDRSNVIIRYLDREYPLGRRKCGAILGDHVEVGCNSVLNPGTVVGKDSRIYPLSSVRGVIPPQHIYKDGTLIVPFR